MNYRGCMVLLTSVSLFSVLLFRYAIWELYIAGITEEEEQSDEFYLKEIPREESADYTAFNEVLQVLWEKLLLFCACYMGIKDHTNLENIKSSEISNYILEFC